MRLYVAFDWKEAELEEQKYFLWEKLSRFLWLLAEKQRSQKDRLTLVVLGEQERKELRKDLKEFVETDLRELVEEERKESRKDSKDYFGQEAKAGMEWQLQEQEQVLKQESQTRLLRFV